MSVETKDFGSTRLRALAAAVRESRIGVLHQDRRLVYDLAENLPDGWLAHPPMGLTDDQALPVAIARVLAPAKIAALAGSPREVVECELTHNGARRLFQAIILPDALEEGAAPGLLTIVSEITEQRERQVAVSSLLRELSHRSKNLLSIIQSVAMQTAYHSGGIQDFLAKFRGRLHALASTQDLVTDSDWQGTRFQALVEAQLARLGLQPLDAIRVDGDDPMLNPNAALHIGLAIHELANNALLHGALASETPGEISITATASGGILTIEWSEHSPIAEPDMTRPRFGSMVLERIVPLSVGGDADFEVGPDRTTYRLRVPADQFAV